MKKKVKSLMVLLIAIFGILICSKVYADENPDSISVFFDVFDKNGVSQVETNLPDNGEFYDGSLNYNDSYCEAHLFHTREDCQYEDTFVVEGLGTFKFIKKETDAYGNMYLIYKADKIDPSYFDVTKERNDTFKVKNLTTGYYNELTVPIYVFKEQFESNANLSVNGIDVIKNGKVLNAGSYVSDIDSYYNSYKDFGCYSRVHNSLTIYNPDIIKTIKFNNMGKNFHIYRCFYGKTDITDTYEFPNSSNGLLVDSQNFYLPDGSFINSEEITSGKVYDNVVNSLGSNYKNIQVQDISIQNLYNHKKIQPNGMLKLYIPIKNNINKSNLEIYRVEDNGNKIKYNATIISDDGVDYAVFETDHFSTYVLAEKIPEEKPVVEQSQKDSENQTNNKAHILDDEPKAGCDERKEIVLIIVTVVATAGITVYLKKFN